MSTHRPHLIIDETNFINPILIIDKNGLISQAVLEKLKQQFLIVLVAGKEITPHKNITYIRFNKKIPMIPDLEYSAMIVTYHGEGITLDILPSIIKKANEINARQLLVTSLDHYDKKIKNVINQAAFANTTLVIYGEIFGADENAHNLLIQYIHQIRLNNKIDIPGNGLNKTYPVLFEDVCDAIISIISAPHVAAKTIMLMPKHGFTQLAVARAFQRLDPLVKVNFTKEKYKEDDLHLPHDAYYYFSGYRLEEKLKKIDLSPVKSQDNKSPKWKSKKIKLPKNSRPLNIYIFLFLCALFFILPFLIEYILLISGGALLLQSYKTAKENNLSLAQDYNSIAEVSFGAGLFMAHNISGINPLLLTQKTPLVNKAQAGIELAQIEKDILESGVLVKAIYNETSGDPKNDFLQVVAKIKNSLISLQKLKAEDNLPPEISEKINTFQKPLMLLGNTADALPDLLGFYQKRKYLVLFQNNMELRPGGGFIGSFGTLEIRNGKIGKLKINDVYDADGKLSTHVEPPFLLKRYMGSQHLFLRDSNFDVDFIADAQRARNFLEMETGEKVDGVIAVDTDFVKAMIELYGPLDIPDFRETVSGDNFYLLTQTHAEKDFFPGSTQKKDFLRAVYNALDAKISGNYSIQFEDIASKISDLIAKKHLLIAMPDTDTQMILSVNKLSGTLQDNRKKEDNKILDFFSINEANIGVNKSNFYLKRNIDQKVTIEENGKISEKINIVYENSSGKESVFGGDYKNYLRFILPANAVLQSVEVNGTNIATTAAITNVNEYTKKGFIPPNQLEVEKTANFGKMIYGFLVIIPMSTSQKISINYTLPDILNPDKGSIIYDLYAFKQPGTGSDPYSVSIIYPKTFQVVQSYDGFSDVGGKLVYSDNLSEDKNLILKFSKK